jgi:glyoxylase-like metal-dependent hydrolase (beta-lactamase superfamily II)
LVASGSASLLVDTLFDLRLTAQMLETMAPHIATRPITTLVNTHANGDHCHGNQLVSGARVITSAATAQEMADLPASSLLALTELDLGEDGNRFVAAAFGDFDFTGIDVPAPTETFSGMLTVDGVVLYEVGPAHTGGDVIAHVPARKVVFTGDICFIGGTPIVWSGPVSNWIAACRLIRSLQPEVVVPGHGPITDTAGVRDIEGYFAWLVAECRVRQAAGLSALEAAHDLDLGPYRRWGESERTVVNVDAVYAELDPSHERMNVLTALQEMGRWQKESRGPPRWRTPR